MRWRLILRNIPRAMGRSGLILFLVIISIVSLEGVAQKSEEAATSDRTTAEGGKVDAQYNLGRAYELGDSAQDHMEAVQWFRMAAEQGSAEAQNNLGEMYMIGLAVAQDHMEAVQWFRMAAEQGSAAAQNNLGLAYYRGEGVAQDNVEAYAWIRIAAAQLLGDAEDSRRGLLEEMTPAQVERAEDLAREYQEKYVKQ